MFLHDSLDSRRDGQGSEWPSGTVPCVGPDSDCRRPGRMRKGRERGLGVDRNERRLDRHGRYDCGSERRRDRRQAGEAPRPARPRRPTGHQRRDRDLAPARGSRCSGRELPTSARFRARAARAGRGPGNWRGPVRLALQGNRRGMSGPCAGGSDLSGPGSPGRPRPR